MVHLLEVPLEVIVNSIIVNFFWIWRPNMTHWTLVRGSGRMGELFWDCEKHTLEFCQSYHCWSRCLMLGSLGVPPDTVSSITSGMRTIGWEILLYPIILFRQHQRWWNQWCVCHQLRGVEEFDIPCWVFLGQLYWHGMFPLIKMIGRKSGGKELSQPISMSHKFCLRAACVLWATVCPPVKYLERQKKYIKAYCALIFAP